MKPKPVQPKRADFSSFDNYFHAMIQYHLELSQEHLENVHSSQTSADSCTPAFSKEEHAVCRNCSNAFECNLRKFSSSYREKVCLILREQSQTVKPSCSYNSGNISLPEERIVWHERLRTFMQEHLQ